MTSSREREVRKAYEALQGRPFPEGSEDETARELHAELVLIDTEFNGLIARSLGGAEAGLFGAEDEWRYLDRKARLESLTRDGSVRAATDARRYLDYLGAIWEVVALVKLQ